MNINTNLPRPQVQNIPPSNNFRPQGDDHYPKESFLSTVGEIAGFALTKLGPTAAVAGGATALALSAWGVGAAIGVGLAVPAAAGLVVSLANSLPGSSHKPGKAIESGMAILGGAVGSAAGAWAGAHFGSALIGAAAGGLAPAVGLVGLVGVAKLASMIGK